MNKSLLIEWVLACMLAALFGYAGIVKIIHPEAFLSDILNYRLTPYPLSWAAALFLPWLELWLATSLLHPKWRITAAVWCSLLMLAFIGALLSAWTRGLDITCGCFGSSDTPTNYPLTLLRDVVILAASLGILWCRKNNRPLDTL